MERLAAALAIVFVCLAPVPVVQAQIGPNLPTPLTEDPPPPPAPDSRHKTVGGRALDPHWGRGYSCEIIVPASPPEEG